jgi:hypothetical protein
VAVGEFTRESHADLRTLSADNSPTEHIDEPDGSAGVRSWSPSDRLKHLAIAIDAAELDIGRANINGQYLLAHRNLR